MIAAGKFTIGDLLTDRAYTWKSTGMKQSTMKAKVNSGCKKMGKMIDTAGMKNETDHTQEDKNALKFMQMIDSSSGNTADMNTKQCIKYMYGLDEFTPAGGVFELFYKQAEITKLDLKAAENAGKRFAQPSKTKLECIDEGQNFDAANESCKPCDNGQVSSPGEGCVAKRKKNTGPSRAHLQVTAGGGTSTGVSEASMEAAETKYGFEGGTHHANGVFKGGVDLVVDLTRSDNKATPVSGLKLELGLSYTLMTLKMKQNHQTEYGALHFITPNVKLGYAHQFGQFMIGFAAGIGLDIRLGEFVSTKGIVDFGEGGRWAGYSFPLRIDLGWVYSDAHSISAFCGLDVRPEMGNRVKIEPANPNDHNDSHFNTGSAFVSGLIWKF